MAKKKQEKRKFIEDIFNLSIFSSMLTEAKNELNEKKNTFNILSAKYDEMSTNLISLEKQKDKLIEERDRKKEKYTSRKESNQKEIKTITERIETFSTKNIDDLDKSIEEINIKIEKADKKINELREDITTNTTLISELEKKIKNVGTDADLCSMCLRTIEDKDKEHIKEEKKKIQEQIGNFYSDNTTLKASEQKYKQAKILLQEKIDSTRHKIHEIKMQNQEKDSLVSRLNQLNSWQKELDIDLKEIQNNDTNFDNLINESREKQEKSKLQIDEIKQNLNKLDTVKFIMSEEGVKSFIVKKILQIFNTRLAYYLKKMDANCICTFNEYFEETIVDDKGKDCSYFNFSGAERKNVDLACLFAFMDIRRLQGNVSFNFSIYDELFDSSLDEKGVELVINILKERVEKFDECAMVISHRKESIKAATGDIIFLEKINGITRKVDYKEYVS
jgi:DNA repair exonuclease SbcCD ATPase subunit